MRALEIITGQVIYNPAYTYKFQLKTTFELFDSWLYDLFEMQMHFFEELKKIKVCMYLINFHCP